MVSDFSRTSGRSWEMKMTELPLSRIRSMCLYSSSRPSWDKCGRRLVDDNDLRIKVGCLYDLDELTVLESYTHQ